MTGLQNDGGAADQAREFLAEPFRLHSIVEVPAPEGGEGVWQQYVIVQGINSINGLRAGTRSEVSVMIEVMIEHLNERFRKGKPGLADSPGRKAPLRTGRPMPGPASTPGRRRGPPRGPLNGPVSESDGQPTQVHPIAPGRR